MLDSIPGFPQPFMDRHMAWHMEPPPAGRSIPQTQPGSGAEFLDWHHQFIIDVKAWYGTQPGADLSKLAGWAQFPADLAAAHGAELTDFEAYAGNPANFTSEDALGIYVEAEHNLVHGYIASFYDESEFGGFDSCKFFMFYQWHGLIDAWRGNWLVHHKSAIKDVIDSSGGIKIHSDVIRKPIFVEVPSKLVFEGTPPKNPKETVEVPGIGDRGDPVELLAHRIALLENALHRRAFIQPQERPEVG